MASLAPWTMQACRTGAHHECHGGQLDRGDGTWWMCECWCHESDLSEQCEYYAESKEEE